MADEAQKKQEADKAAGLNELRLELLRRVAHFSAGAARAQTELKFASGGCMVVLAMERTANVDNWRLSVSGRRDDWVINGASTDGREFTGAGRSPQEAMLHFLMAAESALEESGVRIHEFCHGMRETP